MKQLNFNHLSYFYAVAKAGSVTAAARKLNVTPQTVSGQLATFEDYLGAQLFDRNGKRLSPNSLGKITLGYAEDIFNLGNELSKALASQSSNETLSFSVGVVDAIPKVMVFEMLRVCLESPYQLRLECYEGEFDDLLADLSTNKLDLILSDQPLSTNVSVKAVGHFLGESGLTFFAEHELAEKVRDGFPGTLDNAPFLMPSKRSAQNLNLISWFVENKIKPNIVAEFDDSALLKLFGKKGLGIFCVSASVEKDVIEQFGVEVIGRAEVINDRYHAIVPHRRVRHPAIDSVLANAKLLFSKKKPLY